jgi:limonene 1,2-monooxygenase
MDVPMRFGIFLAPFHPVGQNPTLALERDLELIQHLDRLGYDEAWIGEHHSGGYEIIASPEVFIGVAAQRTRHIKLGTGVSSAAYHHPLILLDRMVLLDHLTRGRVMFGIGPGALPSDAHMMGIDTGEQRRMMEESVDAMVALLRDEEPVQRQTDWFMLRDARLQLRPYSHPCFDIAVAATLSPAGPRLAGRFGLSLLSVGATSAGGFDVLGRAWQIMEERAAEFGTMVDRRGWRLVGPMHIAPTAEQARQDVRFGLLDFHRYFGLSAAFGVKPSSNDLDDVIDALTGSGFAVIGTPDQAVAQIERLLGQTGGFGSYLFMAHDWADTAATLRSYELFARYVMPRFQGSAAPPETSWEWMSGQREQFGRAMLDAQAKATREHLAEQEMKAAAGG